MFVDQFYEAFLHRPIDSLDVFFTPGLSIDSTISGALSAPVPEPSSILLLGVVALFVFPQLRHHGRIAESVSARPTQYS
jgi:hypothetical protein